MSGIEGRVGAEGRSRGAEAPGSREAFLPLAAPEPVPGMRPGLEYQHAFDFCAVEAHRIGRPAAILASSPFYARELLKRLDNAETSLIPTGDWSLYGVSIGRLLGPEVRHPSIQTLERSDVPAKIIVWAEPDRGSWRQVSGYIQRVLLSGGYLCVIASGWLARFLPEWQRKDDRPGERPIGFWQTVKWMRQAGFTVEALYGFHGPVSILWGYAFRLMERLGRSDLADRCLFKMRAEYVVSGWQVMWAPVRVIVARKR